MAIGLNIGIFSGTVFSFMFVLSGNPGSSLYPYSSEPRFPPPLFAQPPRHPLHMQPVHHPVQPRQFHHVGHRPWFLA